MANYKFACSTCSQRIAYDENAFGRKIRCPNCKSIITIPVPEGQAPAAPIAPVATNAPAATPGPKPAGPVAARPVPGKPGVAPPAKPAGGGKKSKKGLFIGLGVTLALAIGGITAFFTMGGGGESDDGAPSLSADTAKADSDDSSSAPDSDPEPPKDMAAAEPAMGMGMGNSMNSAFGDPAPAKGGDLAWVPENSQLLISIQPSELMGAPLIAKLFEMQPQAKMGIAAFEGQAGIKIADIDSVLFVMNGFDEAAKSGFKEFKAAKTVEARKAVEEKYSQDLYAIINLSKPVDFNSLPMIAPQPEVEYNGVKYRRMAPLGGAPPVAFYVASDTTLIVGRETGVKKSLDTKGNSPSEGKGIERLRPDHQVAILFNPTIETLGLMRSEELPDELKENPIAGLFAKHMSGGALSLTSGKAGIDIEATVNGDDAAAAKQINDAAQAGIAGLPAQLEPFKGIIPPALAGPVADLLKSLSSVASDKSVKLSLTVSNEIFSQEAIGGIMQIAMSQGGPPAGGQQPPRKSSGSSANARPKAKEPTPAMASSEPDKSAPPAAAPTTAASDAPSETVAVGDAPPATAAGTTSPTVGSGRVLRAWTMNILNASIPDETVAGQINGVKFTTEAAKVENGVLILRQGGVKYPDLIVEVHNIQRAGELLDGKKYELPVVSGVATPSVILKWQDPKKLRMPTRPFYNNFAIKLEFEKMVDGRIRGKVFIAVPDGRKSYISGAFDAEVF